MDISNMKNMIILKDLPSNIVDEAFVVLKSNKKVKNFEKIEKSQKFDSDNEYLEDNEYVIKEAEMLITDYISKIEKNDKKNLDVKDKCFKKYKKWAYLSSLAAILEFIILLTS